MNCVVPGRGIRAFGKAIQCLAKIGNELYIEALRKGLALKTVNSARSAFASFLFCRKFFHSYNDGQRSGQEGGGEGEEREEDTIKCKITIKSCLNVFRALSSLEKTVDHFTMTLNLKLSKLVFIFHCRHGIVKTHNLGFQECEALQAVFTKDLSPNHIKVQSRTLGEVVLNFPSFLEEVTMTADPECVRLKNYAEEDSVDTRSTVTEVCLVPAEFDDYQIGVDTAITFCLKELRAVLLFTDTLPHSLSVRFESSGRPVVFSIDDSSDFQADFVLATLLGSTSTYTESGVQQAKIVSANLPSRHPSIVRGRKNSSNRQNKVMQNGRGKQSVNEEGPSHYNEDEWNHPFSIPARDLNSAQGRERDVQATSNTKNSAGNSSTSTSSQSGLHSTTQNGSSRHSVSRIPSDGSGEDVMVEGGYVEEDGEGRGGERGSGGVTQVSDPLDALFGEENMMDVAGEEGEGGGWEGGGGAFGMVSRPLVTTTHREEPQKPISDEPLSRSPLAPLTTSTMTTSPHSPHYTHHHPPLSPTREDGWEEEREREATPTQDSILQDSGFLPGTPPAKKFKPASLLFRVGMLTSDLSSTPGQPEILAPDSEEDSD